MTTDFPIVRQTREWLTSVPTPGHVRPTPDAPVWLTQEDLVARFNLSDVADLETLAVLGFPTAERSSFRTERGGNQVTRIPKWSGVAVDAWEIRFREAAARLGKPRKRLGLL